MQEKYGDEYWLIFFREHLKRSIRLLIKRMKKYLKGTTGGNECRSLYTLFKGNINNEK